MTWFQKLYETYGNVIASDLFTDEENALMPVAHSSQQAHIIVRIDGEGRFLDAEYIGKTSVILPATEESAGRTSGRVAHPLIDQIKYCARDYPEFSGEEGFYDLYEKTLKNWVRSPYTHPMAQAVYTYISKGTLVHDLVEKKILRLDETGHLATVASEGEDIPVFKVLTAKKGKDGVNRRYQGDLMIAWQVEIPGENESKTWKSKSLQSAWTAYDASQMEKRGMCMVTGEDSLLAGQHPRNIRRPGDGAKLISANDKSGFTFRGRFITPEDACAVGYETSHMAHNALRWLIARQGYKNGDQIVLSWAISGIPVPQPVNDDWMSDDEDNIDFSSDGAVLPENTAATQENGIRHGQDLGQTFASKLARSLKGFDEKFQATDTIAILGLDSATTGRLSVSFYRELLWSDYLRALENWQKDLSWLLRRNREIDIQKTGGKKTVSVWKMAAPTPNEIVMAAYGKRSDDKLKKNTVERLLPCIADERSIPFDLLNACINRACSRAGMDNWEWETTLGVACALYKGYYKRHPEKQKRREFDMSLDDKNTSRDYLFGRLLAVAERIEKMALWVAGENRPTNAERLMQRFSDSPYSTWRQLEMALQPYRQRLLQSRSGFMRHMDKLLDDVIASFTPEDFMKPGRLGGEFLLGYHCQRQAFNTDKESPSNDNTQGEKQ